MPPGVHVSAATVPYPTQLFSNPGQIGTYHISKVIYCVVQLAVHRGRRRNANSFFFFSLPWIPDCLLYVPRFLVCLGSYHKGWRVGQEYWPTRELGSSGRSWVVKNDRVLTVSVLCTHLLSEQRCWPWPPSPRYRGENLLLLFLLSEKLKTNKQTKTRESNKGAV